MRPLSLSVLALLLAAPVLAGCVSPAAQLDGSSEPPATDFSGLSAPNAAQTALNADGTLSFVFEGVTKGGATVLLSVPREGDLVERFQVDERVGYVEARIEMDEGPTGAEGLIAMVQDAEGRTQCGALTMLDPPTCTAPVVGGAAEWEVAVAASGLAANPPGIPFTVTLTLHPLAHVTRGDPLAGLDPTVSFRVSDTGVEGAEDNIGVLGDGTVFTQKGTSTLRSRDDGATWETVSPPGNDRTTLDPMLFVDPRREVVFVDHLYVACSALSWSKDAGETWLTNPAACGRPGNDHQKVASGPSPLPGGLPAVYYSYSIPGVWVSRSLDGGLTWTSSPVVGVTDERVPNNTGPVWADEEGNVYVPYYMCDSLESADSSSRVGGDRRAGEGYMGVGVSHDHGLTWKFVVAAEDPGPCSDVDPGLWADEEGAVYLAYHRPTGVKYVASQDHGETWGAPVTVSPPTLRSFVHVDVVAGDAGRLAVVYRATPDTDKGPDAADGWAAWHLYVTFVEDATSAAPVIRTGIVNDPAQPVQRGPICTMGIACVGGSRNLLDFIDIAVGPDGRVYPTYTSGCSDACPTPADSREALGLVGVQVDGPRLWVDKAPWAK